MFFSVILLLIVIGFAREALVSRVLKPLWSCDDWIHYLYRYCATSHSDVYFIKYYKAKEELERRKSAIASVQESKFSILFMKLMLPGERKYYNEFVNKISELEVERDRAYVEYREWQEERIKLAEEDNAEKAAEEAKIRRIKDSRKRREKKAMRKQSIGNLMQATVKSL